MVVYNAYSKNVKIKYKTTIISKATILYVISGLFSIVLPFILAYRSDGFWLKRSIFFEQASIHYKGDYLFVATTTNLSNPIKICTTFPYYRQVLNFEDVCSLAKAREIDFNYDGKIDKFTFSLSLNLEGNTKITSANIILPIDYKLNNDCPLQMESAIIHQIYSIQPITTELTINGDLKFFQSTSIVCNKRYFTNFYNNTIMPVGKDSADYNPENIITKFMERNISTHLTNIYTTIKIQNKNKFTINLSVRYPENQYYYKPGFWQTVKFAWMQYFAIYIIIYWITKKINSYIFDNRLLLVYEESPFKK